MGCTKAAKRYSLLILLALVITCVTAPEGKAQEAASQEATPELLQQLLPEPPEEFVRAMGRAYEGQGGPRAQAIYVLNGEEYRDEDGAIRLLDRNEGDQVGFEVKIQAVTEEQRRRELEEIESARSEIEIQTEEHEGNSFYLVSVGEKSFLYLFMGSFQVYMEGNAAPAHLREALESIDLEALGRYD